MAAHALQPASDASGEGSDPLRQFRNSLFTLPIEARPLALLGAVLVLVGAVAVRAVYSIKTFLGGFVMMGIGVFTLGIAEFLKRRSERKRESDRSDLR